MHFQFATLAHASVWCTAAPQGSGQGSKVCAKFLAGKIFREKKKLPGLSGGAAGCRDARNAGTASSRVAPLRCSLCALHIRQMS